MLPTAPIPYMATDFFLLFIYENNRCEITRISWWDFHDLNANAYLKARQGFANCQVSHSAWCLEKDLHFRHVDFQSTALLPELPRHIMVSGERLELSTTRLKIACSTNWATRSSKMAFSQPTAHLFRIWFSVFCYLVPVATRMGFEPMLSCVTGTRFNQLSYQAKI